MSAIFSAFVIFITRLTLILTLNNLNLTHTTLDLALADPYDANLIRKYGIDGDIE